MSGQPEEFLDSAQFTSEEGAQRDTTEFGHTSNIGLSGIRKLPRVPMPGIVSVPDDAVEIEYTDGEFVGVETTREEGAVTFDARTVFANPSTTTGFAGEPVMLAARDSRRSRLLIRNGHATDSLYVGPLSSVSNGGGYILPALQMLTTEIQGAVYAIVPVAGVNAIPIGVWIETDAG